MAMAKGAWAAILALTAVVTAAGGWWWAYSRANDWALDPEAVRKARLMEDVMWGRAAIGGSFSLTDHTGQRRTLADLRGKVVLLYFGYTFCPDVCPTDLVAISRMLDVLGSDGERVQPVFITIDPERDTVAQLALFVPHFHPRLIGLTGSVAEVREATDAYKAYFKTVPAKDGAYYFMDHSAYIYLLDKEGRYAGLFPPGTSAERLATVVREELAATLAR